MDIKRIIAFAAFSYLSFFAINLKAQDVLLEEQEETLESNTSTTDIQYPIRLDVNDIRDGRFHTVLIEDPAVIEQRLKSIENIMPMVYNSDVKKWLDFFITQRPSFTQEMMEEKDRYFPVFERYLAKNGMPIELKYLSILESGLNPKAVSRSKAVGLWQFMSFTGREMGLTINKSMDERMHIEKSTEAACKYLKNLYYMFEDWDLALASYNTGFGRISRTIKSTGLKNYWDLHPYIHPDTRAYVPQFIALAYLMNFGELHGIRPRTKSEYVPTETIFVSTNLDLKTFAEMNNMSLQELKKYNPQFKTNILPESPYGIEVLLPTSKMGYFNQNKLAILEASSRRPEPQAVETEEVLTSSTDKPEILPTQTEEIVIGRSQNSKLNVPNLVVKKVSRKDAQSTILVNREVKKIHTVKRGEFLNRIASKYDVTTYQIKKWNGMRKSKVLVGEKLTIFVNEKRRVNANSIAAAKRSSSLNKSYYTVRPGDTLWNISQRYEGVSVQDIKKWNNIKGNTVKVGQKIKVNKS